MIGRAKQRQIFLHGSAGQRQLREVLSAQLCCSDYAARANLAGFAVGE